MNIVLPFELGDSLFWVNTIEEGEGPVLAEICEQKNAIQGIQYGLHESVKVFDGDTYGEIGTQYANLAAEDAKDWLDRKFPDAIFLDGKSKIEAMYVDTLGDASFVTILCSIADLDSYVSGGLATTELDANGIFAIYDSYARKNGDPISRFCLNDAGEPVDVMFGAFLLLQAKTSSDGKSVLCSIDRSLFEEET